MILWTKELRNGLLGFRSFLFWLVFLFYVKDELYTSTALLYLAGINIWTVILLYTGYMSRPGWIAIILADLAGGALIISQTGQWNSPFLLYGLSGLLWLGALIHGYRLIVFILLFLAACYGLPQWISERYILPSISQSLLHFLVYTSACICAYFLMTYTVSELNQIYRRATLYAWYLRRLEGTNSRRSLTRLTERVARHLFPTNRVYLCWLDQQDANLDWRRQYYASVLSRREWTGRASASLLSLTSAAGEEERYCVMPIGSGDQPRGALLIPLSSGTGMGTVRKRFLRLLSLSVNNQLRRYDEQYGAVQQARLEMRKQLAQDMHDGLAQQLFFLSARLYRLKRHLTAAHHEVLAKELDKILQEVNHCHAEVRDYIQQLRGDSPGLFSAVRGLLERVMAGSGVEWSFETKGQVLQEDERVERAVYRLVQESVQNVLKHASATRLDVGIEVNAVQWTVRIRDNGIGFAAEEVSVSGGHFGLTGMEERIHRLGGTLVIRSAPGHGTDITAMIPREGKQDND